MVSTGLNTTGLSVRVTELLLSTTILRFGPPPNSEPEHDIHPIIVPLTSMTVDAVSTMDDRLPIIFVITYSSVTRTVFDVNVSKF